MFNPFAGVWSAELPPPPARVEGTRKQHKYWCEAWQHYCVLYDRFQAARLEPDGEAELGALITELSQCDYVHLLCGRTRVLQSVSGDPVVRDITERRCLLRQMPEDIMWCSDSSINLNVLTGRMQDVSATHDNALVLERAEPDNENASCIYLSKDPRVSAAYEEALWRVVKQQRK